jgi:hypothetical protein
MQALGRNKVDIVSSMSPFLSLLDGRAKTKDSRKPLGFELAT